LLFYKCQSTIVLNLSLNWKVFYIDICCFSNVWYPNYFIKSNAERFHWSTTKMLYTLLLLIYFWVHSSKFTGMTSCAWRCISMVAAKRRYQCYWQFEISLHFYATTMQTSSVLRCQQICSLSHCEGGKHRWMIPYFVTNQQI
jgi:hypothetical protein